MEIQASCIRLGLQGFDKEKAIRLTGEILVEEGYVEDQYVDAMIQREKDLSTYMGNGVAIPHGTLEAKKLVKKSGISVVQFPSGVDFGDDQVAHIIFGIAAKDDEHLDLLSQIAIFCSQEENVEKLKRAKTKAEFLSFLQEAKQ